MKASPIALAAEAQAVATAEFGPAGPSGSRPGRWPALTISLGIVNGLIRDGPLFIIVGVLGLELVEAADPRADEHAAVVRAGSVAKSIPESATAEIGWRPWRTARSGRGGGPP